MTIRYLDPSLLQCHLLSFDFRELYTFLASSFDYVGRWFRLPQAKRWALHLARWSWHRHLEKRAWQDAGVQWQMQHGHWILGASVAEPQEPEKQDVNIRKLEERLAKLGEKVDEWPKMMTVVLEHGEDDDIKTYTGRWALTSPYTRKSIPT